MAGLIWLWNQGGAAPPTPEPEEERDTSTVLGRRKARKSFGGGTGSSFTYERFLKFLEELEEKDEALVAKLLGLPPKQQERASGTVTKAREALVLAGALGPSAGPVFSQVEKRARSLNRAMASAIRAETTGTFLSRMKAIREASEGLERAIQRAEIERQDDEDIEMLLLSL